MKSSLFDNDALLLIVGLLLATGSVVAFFLQRGRHKSKFIAMRRQQGIPTPQVTKAAGPQAPGVVRSTDVVRLSREDEAKMRKANALIAEGSILEGARLLEGINMQRHAISALEQAGLVDDACAILMRMNRPNRAGVIYQRNNKPVKAAEHFLIANLPVEAARCYLEAGKDNPDYFRKAADTFEGLGRHDEALDALARGELMDAFVHFCLKHSCWEKLRDAMHDAKTTRAGFAILDMYSTKKLVKSIPLDTQTAQNLAMWCKTVKRVELIEMALRKLGENKNLLALFWSLLPDDFTGQIVTSLLSAPQFKTDDGKPFLIRNARALYDGKRPMQAALLYEQTGRLVMAAKCQALVGDLGYALDLLSLPGGDEVLAHQLAVLLSPHVENPRARHAKFPGDLTAQAVRIFAAVDPDGDELHTHSPFSLTA